MSKTIKLNTDLEYKKELKELSDYLVEVEQNLLLKGINLAILDKWKNTAKTGEVVWIDVNNLRGTGDNNVDNIVELIDSLLYIKKKIDDQLK